MAKSLVVGTKRDGSIVLSDSGGSNTTTLYLEVGDFTFEEPKADRVVIRDRGSLSGGGLRKGDDAVGSCSFTVHFTEFTNAGAGNIMDWCYQRGSASGYTSVGGAGFEQFLVDIVYTCNKTALGDAAPAVATLNKVLLFASFAEGDSDTLTVTGEIYGSYTYTGIT